MRIGIVGAGISGLGTAWYLSESGHEVTVFEASPRLGGHSQTLSLALMVEGKSVEVAVNPAYDIFCETSYPRFTALLAELGAHTEPREFSYTYEVMSDKRDGEIVWTVRMPTLLNVRNSLHLKD